jgi:SAM-dependent methyltransferase
MTSTVYDSIGTEYATLRRADPRWIARVEAALVGASTLVNVGAGTGSYEPAFLQVTAVEPSAVMVRQRPRTAAPVVRGTAERLPFRDGAFDVALAVLTVHHWQDAQAGLAELRRVARRQVVLTWDPGVFARQFWLVRDYLPQAAERERRLATLSTVVDALMPTSIEVLPVPADCTDGFFGAYWRRPHVYLEAAVRGAISGLALLDPPAVTAAMVQLRSDLESGQWQRRYSDLLALDEIDLGYRLVVAGA